MIPLCVLDTMWDWRSKTSAAGFEKAPNFFCINPQNHSGKRLFQLTGLDPKRTHLWCTNVCPELVSGPKHHGTPNLERLAANLTRWEVLVRKKWVTKEEGLENASTLLVCGNVAQSTFLLLKEKPLYRTIFIPHPAARSWTRKMVKKVSQFIQEGKANLRMRIIEREISVRRLER